MTDDNHTHALEDVDTIIVDPDDIIETMQRNRRDADESRTHVLRITPPLEGEHRAKLHCSKNGAYYPDEMDPKPVHFMPKDFLTGHTEDSLPSSFNPPDRRIVRSQFRQAAHIDIPEDTTEWTEADEQLFEEYFEETETIWLDHVHSNLADSITSEELTTVFEDGQLKSASVTATVDVEYISEGDD